jgi:hypothetical protein
MIDPSTIYVSAWRWEIGEDPVADLGTRENPYVFLDDALDRAQRERRRLIHLTGYAILRRNQEITGDIEIDGSYDENWDTSGSKAYIEVPEGVTIRVRGSLNLRDVAVERMNGSGSLFHVRSGGVLVLDDSGISHMGPLLNMERNGTCLMQYISLLSMASGGEYVSADRENQRIPVITASGASLTIRQSRWEMEGSYGILCALQGGNFRAELSNFRMAAQTTGTAFILSGTGTELQDLSLSVQAQDYASALELSGARLRVSGGQITVSARDAVAIITENTDAGYFGTGFTVISSFVSRGMEIRDRFPLVSGCNFTFSGSTRRSDVFSAFRTGETRLGTLVPAAGAVGDNSFQGFTHILGTNYPVNNIQEFNRLFAPAGHPNTIR